MGKAAGSEREGWWCIILTLVGNCPVVAEDNHEKYFSRKSIVRLGAAVAQWLRCCATNRKVAGSIPDGVIGIFH